MKSGYHDDVLVEATKEADVVFWKSEDKAQLDKLIKLDSNRSKLIDSIEETSKEILESIEQDTLVVVMSNADFEGLSQKLIDRT